ncbi:type III pantothenate kinase [Halioxenophilus sp. WMMB6]|uniref:type III pantothenate kinase n=1 Tax=Halioxenophilus sp. WMMB6 TaxID=3073815 RepID=UPI00295E3FA4|nr:type III pantothenate kinase [Halioxenophilus sp. WMMB6]
MILEVDQGNTRFKWRVRAGDDQIVAFGSELNSEIGNLSWLRQLEAVLAGRALQSVAVGSVAKVSYQQDLLDLCRQHLAIEPMLMTAEREFVWGNSRLLNSYADVKRMGVDRWAAMVAAVCEWPGDVLVVADAGTAINVEVIAPGGEHVGGYIAPGLQMMQSSLLTNTGAIVMGAEARERRQQPGTNTAEAVGHGVFNAGLGLIERAHNYALGRWRESTITLILTGGDALVLHEALTQAQLRPDLVLDGLKHMLRAHQCIGSTGE